MRFRLRVPEVVALSGYDRTAGGPVTFSRRNIFKRDHYTCQYCGAQPGSEELTLDHVVPRSQGGVSSWENCVLACMACNKRKADRTPEQARMHLRASRSGRRGSRSTRTTRCGSKAGRSSSAKRTGTYAARVVVTPRPPVARPGADTGVSSWERKRSPKPPNGVQILALLLIADVAD